MNHPIFIITGNEIETSFELAAFAEKLSSITGAPLKAVSFSGDMPERARAFAESTGIDTVVLKNDKLENRSPEALISSFLNYMPRPGFSCLIFPDGAEYSGTAAALAAVYGVPRVTSVEFLDSGENGLRFTRTVWHGKIREEISSDGSPVIITVAPGSFSSEAASPEKAGGIEVIEIETDIQNTLEAGFTEGKTEDSPITGADVIVSAGGGAEKAFHEGLIESLAGVFPRSAIGGSRVACDKGFISYGSQIGITGRTVSPKLYIACGISGSLQHIAGIRGSNYIAAVNKDPDAPIFRVADIGFVDELENFIPEFLSLIENSDK